MYGLGIQGVVGGYHGNDEATSLVAVGNGNCKDGHNKEPLHEFNVENFRTNSVFVLLTALSQFGHLLFFHTFCDKFHLAHVKKAT